MQVRWLPVVVALLMIGALAVVPQARAEDVGKFSRVVNQVEQLKKGQEPPLPAKVPPWD